MVNKGKYTIHGTYWLLCCLANVTSLDAGARPTTDLEKVRVEQNESDLGPGKGECVCDPNAVF